MAQDPVDSETKGRKGLDAHTPERILAVAGVVALLTVGLVVFIMILSVGGDDNGATAGQDIAAEATPTSTPIPTPTPSATAKPLTPVERGQRDKAAELVRSRSFEVTKLADYNPRKKLTALIGRQGDNTRLAFFFVDNEYIGNDSTDPSAKLKVVKATRTQVTLAYGIYATEDKVCCPTGGPVEVRFRWNGAKLEPRDPLPPPQQRTPSRRAPE